MSTTGVTAEPRITLDWPHDPGYRPVGRLVLGGVAARFDVPVDRIDELGLALDTLSRAPVAAGRLRLEIDVASDHLSIVVGVFAADPLADPAIRRVVTALADGVDSVITPEGHRVALTVMVTGQPVV